LSTSNNKLLSQTLNSLLPLNWSEIISDTVTVRFITINDAWREGRSSSDRCPTLSGSCFSILNNNIYFTMVVDPLWFRNALPKTVNTSKKVDAFVLCDYVSELYW